MYRPLPNNLTIKESSIEGLGLFATEDIPKGTNLGRTHFKEKNKLERTPLGGFYNHSDNPNCIKESGPYTPVYYLVALRDIQAGEEITVKYTFYDIEEEEELIIEKGGRKFIDLETMEDFFILMYDRLKLFDNNSNHFEINYTTGSESLMNCFEWATGRTANEVFNKEYLEPIKFKK